MFPIVS